MPVATFRYTDEYFIEAQARFQRQSAAARVLWMLPAGVIVSFLPMAIYLGMDNGNLWGMGLAVLTIVGGLIVGLLFRGRVERWLLLRTFRQSPMRDHLMRVEMRDDGFHVRGDIAAADLTWAALNKVVHFRDGFLLFQGPRSIHWVPVRCLESAESVAELEALLRDKIGTHVVVEPVTWTSSQNSWN